eukprot:CAMPEP_0194201800 /NCGR_PEP_ID=MMETSP0156-20130528/1975_1 /TAXON_ID=33649 /ORGANISM="Thalassionema nitzschioides, Strain L26-B" /LENGTH=392 /DNA_ID=CAMNT_0038927093 /DNA_START=35 /DNA_END=1213 /DNA_ORIENTATION=-
MKTSFWLFFVLLTVVTTVIATEAEETSGDDNKTDETSQGSTFNAEDHKDWGSYYDPKNEFCGKFDCYKILGFDYESFGKEHATKKEITQRYRTLSRVWHPDKNKKRADAKERFVKIARAYEVLTDEEKRKEYDFLRYNQEAYMKKYGSDVMWTYAPKSDTLMVVIGLLVAGSVISWFIQKQQWQNVADKIVKAAVEDLGMGKGGSSESKKLRDKALTILEEQEKNNSENGDSNGDAGVSKKEKKKQKKLTASEKRKQMEDSLRPIVTDLVQEMDDFGAGYHKPTWKDLMVVKLVLFPVVFAKGVAWNTMYGIRRLRKLPLSDEEREVLTRRALGEIAWTAATEEDQKEMIKRDLWVGQNMLDWEEEQEVKLLSAADRKRYNRMKKKGKGKED